MKVPNNDRAFIPIEKIRDYLLSNSHPKGYSEFIERVEELNTPKGGKTVQVLSCIKSFESAFTLSQLHVKCPGVSKDMVRKVLKDLKNQGKIESEGRGQGARWYKRG